MWSPGFDSSVEWLWCCGESQYFLCIKDIPLYSQSLILTASDSVCLYPLLLLFSPFSIYFILYFTFYLFPLHSLSLFCLSFSLFLFPFPPYFFLIFLITLSLPLLPCFLFPSLCPLVWVCVSGVINHELLSGL